MLLSVYDEIVHISAVLQNRGINVDKILQVHMDEKSSQEKILLNLVGILYDGLAYANWPKD